MIELPNRSAWNRLIGARLEPLYECWVWSGAQHPFGYGIVYVNGSTELAHRESVRLAGGGDPHGRVVRHACDNPACCRPDHLLLGTQGDNARDARDRQHTSTLTAEDVTEIRRLVAEGPRGTAIALARQYRVNRSTISRIVNGGRWADVK